MCDIVNHNKPEPRCDLIDDIKFENLISNINESNNEDSTISCVIGKDFNYCPDCIIAMDLTISGFECSNCGMQKQIDGGMKDCDEDSTGTFRVCKAGQNSFYNITPDYAKTQKKAVIEQLNRLNSLYSGPEIPKNILTAVATIYNDIQKMIINNQKKFVRRGNIKDEVIGALIKYECIRADIPRKNKSICDFMRLTSSGISRGEEILRNLHLDGKIDIPIDKDPGSRYTEIYMKNLGIESNNYSSFVNELVEISIKKKIGMNSIMTSKIAGAIWVLITHEKLNITSQQLETATENIRKNTWNRFSKSIELHILKFIDIFNKWNINHGVGGTLIKKKDLNSMTKKGIIKNYSIIDKI